LRASTRRARKVMRLEPLSELRDLLEDRDAPLMAIAETARRVRLALAQVVRRSEDHEPLLDDLTVEIEALHETVREVEDAARSHSDPTNAIVAFLVAIKCVEHYGELGHRHRRPR